MHWPAVATHSVTAIEGAREQHVLCADQNAGSLRVHVPTFVFIFQCLPAHKHDRGMLEQPLKLLIGVSLLKLSEPLLNYPFCLLDQSPHRKAIDQSPRP